MLPNEAAVYCCLRTVGLTITHDILPTGRTRAAQFVLDERYTAAHLISPLRQYAPRQTAVVAVDHDPQDFG